MIRELRHAAAGLLLLAPLPALAGPPADLDELAWLAGEWAGSGIDGAPAGESYSPPAGGQMAGHFWQLTPAGEVQFYEFITFVPDKEGSLVLRLKHFDGDMRGWEQPGAADALEFPLTAREADRWDFSAVTFERDGPDRLRIAVRIRKSDGSPGTFTFDYRRTR